MWSPSFLRCIQGSQGAGIELKQNVSEKEGDAMLLEMAILQVNL